MARWPSRYDPQLGRFLQPGPVIQEPTNARRFALSSGRSLPKLVAAVPSSFGAAVQFIWHRCPTGWLYVLPAMYATIAPSDRQEAFAAEANAILELVEPQHHLALFERLESIVLLTGGFERPLAANG